MKRLLLALVLVGCGADNFSDTKIVNGTPTYRQWYGRMEVGGGFRCGATLIKKRWMLTAEHCLRNPNQHSRVKVRLGAYDLSRKDNGGKPYDLVPVKNVILHPDRDLALLELARDARFKPIPYANRTFQENEKLQAFGMGNTGHDERNGKRLLGVTLLSRGPGPNSELVYTKASPKLGGVCFGDSGGPLITRNGGRAQLIGVASWTGSRCASKNGRDGFAKPDVNWIKEVIRG